MSATAEIKIEKRGVPDDSRDCILVNVVWSGAKLDRPCTGGYRLSMKHMKLAKRLAAAINAGAVYTNPKIKEDIHGHTYVVADCHVMGRYMNRDLKALGF